jgi:hypothetical protein
MKTGCHNGINSLLDIRLSGYYCNKCNWHRQLEHSLKLMIQRKIDYKEEACNDIQTPRKMDVLQKERNCIYTGSVCVFHNAAFFCSVTANAETVRNVHKAKVTE